MKKLKLTFLVITLAILSPIVKKPGLNYKQNTNNYSYRVIKCFMKWSFGRLIHYLGSSPALYEKELLKYYINHPKLTPASLKSKNVCYIEKSSLGF